MHACMIVYVAVKHCLPVGIKWVDLCVFYVAWFEVLPLSYRPRRPLRGE